MKNSDTDQDTTPRRFGETELRSLGRYLLEQRKSAGLTLRRLSELSGVSVASIRALEAGRSSPSLTTVLGVVDALGGTIDRAIAEAQVSEKRVVVSRNTLTANIDGRSLSEGLAEAALDARIIALEPGKLHQMPAEIGEAPSLCMVVGGAVIASLNDAERVRLLAGDTYHAQPGKVLAWANPGKVPALLVCVADNTRRILKTAG